jgi:hypothetical protein
LHIFKGKKDQFIRVIRKVEWNYHSVEPAIYTAFFHDPDQCEDRSTHFREKLPKYDKQITEAIRGDVLEGVYIEHTALGGRIIIALMIIISFAFAVIWSAKKTDVSGGFGVGLYILTAIPIIILFFHNRKD